MTTTPTLFTPPPVQSHYSFSYDKMGLDLEAAICSTVTTMHQIVVVSYATGLESATITIDQTHVIFDFWVTYEAAVTP